MPHNALKNILAPAVLTVGVSQHNVPKKWAENLGSILTPRSHGRDLGGGQEIDVAENVESRGEQTAQDDLHEGHTVR